MTVKIFVYINSELNNCWEYDDISKLILYSIDFLIMIIVLILQFLLCKFYKKILQQLAP